MRTAGADVRCPIRVLEVELSRPLTAIAAHVDGRTYRGAHVLVRGHRRPLGIVRIGFDGGGVPADAVADLLRRELGDAVVDALAPPDPPGAGAPPPVSVIVPTCDRPELLRECLDSLLAVDYRGDYEVIVVDNAPDRPKTAALVQHSYGDEPRVRVLVEPRPGVGRARAAGLGAAGGELVAFVDDDVVVDPAWLTAIAGAFVATERVAAVTTLILPRELETPAQLWLEQFGGFAKGFRRRVFDLEEHRSPDVLYPYSPGIYGSGASMAFRTQVLRELGCFDRRLTFGGEDLDLFLKVVLRGHRLVYEPSAIAWHRHPAEYASLRRTMFSYGAGLTALMTKWAVSDPAVARDIVRRLPAALRLALDPGSRKNAHKLEDFPRELTRIERAGMLVGPFLLARSTQRARAQGAG
jgi:GT2 family glycosyltransferase